jgi:hypothetical protein
MNSGNGTGAETELNFSLASITNYIRKNPRSIILKVLGNGAKFGTIQTLVLIINLLTHKVDQNPDDENAKLALNLLIWLRILVVAPASNFIKSLFATNREDRLKAYFYIPTEMQREFCIAFGWAMASGKFGLSPVDFNPYGFLGASACTMIMMGGTYQTLIYKVLKKSDTGEAFYKIPVKELYGMGMRYVSPSVIHFVWQIILAIVVSFATDLSKNKIGKLIDYLISCITQNNNDDVESAEMRNLEAQSASSQSGEDSVSPPSAQVSLSIDTTASNPDSTVSLPVLEYKRSASLPTIAEDSVKVQAALRANRRKTTGDLKDELSGIDLTEANTLQSSTASRRNEGLSVSIPGSVTSSGRSGLQDFSFLASPRTVSTSPSVASPASSESSPAASQRLLPISNNAYSRPLNPTTTSSNFLEYSRHYAARWRAASSSPAIDSSSPPVISPLSTPSPAETSALNRRLPPIHTTKPKAFKPQN